jgi:hypothetical protein
MPRTKRRHRRLSQKELKKAQEEYLDFWSRCVTESIFYLTPYIIIFIILGFIFN